MKVVELVFVHFLFLAAETRNATTRSTKPELRVWLQTRGIPFDQSMLRAELLLLCRQHKVAPQYVFDKLLIDHGHKVIRIPPYHSDLNPIELVWGRIKDHACQRMTHFSVAEAKEAFTAGHAVVTTDNLWEKFVGHVIKKEDE